MKTYSKLLIATVAFSLMACATKPKPNKVDIDSSKWLVTYKADYPESQYMYYLGEAPYKKVAEDQAKKGVAEMFSTKIQAVTTSKEETLEQGMVFRQSYSSTSNIRTSTSLELKNLKLSQSYHDANKGIYYILATLDKPETARIYETEIQELYNEVDQLYSSYLQNKDILVQLAMVSKAISLHDQAKELLPILHVLNKGMSVLSQPRVTQVQLAEIQFKLLNNITWFVSKDAFENEKLANMVQKQLNALGFKLQDQEKESMLSITGSLKLEKSAVENQDAKLVNWFANIEIFDLRANKKQMGKFQTKGRSSQLNYQAATERAYYDLDKKITTEFNQFLISKLLNL